MPFALAMGKVCSIVMLVTPPFALLNEIVPRPSPPAEPTPVRPPLVTTVRFTPPVGVVLSMSAVVTVYAAPSRLKNAVSA